ncbi:MAG: hypothetical protein P8O91_07375 [Luminiphilus sp.]|nr:hypothetical protein [Luminiphilus sp.]
MASRLWARRRQSGVIYSAMVMAICLVTTLVLLSAYEGSMVGLLRHGSQLSALCGPNVPVSSA